MSAHQTSSNTVHLGPLRDNLNLVTRTGYEGLIDCLALVVFDDRKPIGTLGSVSDYSSDPGLIAAIASYLACPPEQVHLEQIQGHHVYRTQVPGRASVVTKLT